MPLSRPAIRFNYVSSAGLVEYPPRATFGPRAMRDFEFVWIIAGRVRYDRDGASHDCPPGSIALCQPGATDFFEWDTARPTRHAYFHFGLSSAPRHLPAPSTWPVVVRGDGPASPHRESMRRTFELLVQWTGAQVDPLRILLVEQLLTLFVRSGEFDATPRRDVEAGALPEAVEQTLAFIRSSLNAAPDRAIALDDLARAAHVTPGHLCRLFRRFTGRSPAQTVRLARLDRALQLVSRSNYPVGVVAEQCGFASAFHFSRVFAQAFGASPLKVRRAVREGRVPPLPLLSNQLVQSHPR